MSDLQWYPDKLCLIKNEDVITIIFYLKIDHFQLWFLSKSFMRISAKTIKEIVRISFFIGQKKNKKAILIKVCAEGRDAEHPELREITSKPIKIISMPHAS